MNTKKNKLAINPKKKQKLDELLNKSNRITLLGHKNPDYDCILSMLALREILINTFDKNVDIVFSGTLPLKTNRFTKHIQPVDLQSKNPLTYKYTHKDLLIIVDASGSYRSNNDLESIDLEQFAHVAVIDHHKPKENEYEIKHRDLLISHDTPSCAEIVYVLCKKDIQQLPKKVKEHVCFMLIFAILDDSQIFYIPETTNQTVAIVMDLLKVGTIEISDVINMYYAMPFAYLKLYATFVTNLKEHKYGFRYIFLEEPLENKQLYQEVKNHFKNELTRIEDGDVNIYFQKNELTRTKGIYQLRFRSRHTDLSKFYPMLHPNGGGHPHSGGSMITAKSDSEALEIVAKKYKEFREETSS